MVDQQAIDVDFTDSGQAQVDALRGEAGTAFWSWFVDLQRRGCEAAGYRLTGHMAEQVCCRHLRRQWRVLVMWRSPTEAVVIAVGEHNSGPDDVYASLWRAMGIQPPAAVGREKPACCEPAGGRPPLAEDALVEELLRFRARRRGRSRNR